MVSLPKAGDFSWHPDATLLADAYKAVSLAEAWPFLRDESPPEDKGFMFWGHPTVKQIETKMEMLDAHSGASFGWTLRQMEAIAKLGWEAWATARARDT